LNIRIVAAIHPSVSVVVPAYNEEAHIVRLLRSLRRQDTPPREVIVADDGSTDATAAVARDEGATVIELPHRGPAAAKNAGAQAARGEVLAFLDADMDCRADFLRKLVLPIAEGRAIGTFTRDVYIANTENRWARAYAAIRWSPAARLLPENFPDRWTQFRALPRDEFVRAGGFADVGYGEDMTLADRVGELAVAADGAVVHHYHPSSLGEIYENGRWVGRGSRIRTLPHPWRDHALPRVLALGVHQVVRGRTPWVIPARVVYHVGVWVGLAQSSRRPDRHWK
jgi:glycosyltransferase involved in cell wall biosynthesis